MAADRHGQRSKRYLESKGHAPLNVVPSRSTIRRSTPIAESRGQAFNALITCFGFDGFSAACFGSKQTARLWLTGSAAFVNDWEQRY